MSIITPKNEIATIVNRCRRTYRNRTIFPVAKRKELLHTLVKLLDENLPAFHEAAYKDLRKSSFELDVSEIGLCKNDAFLAISKLEAWMKPKAVELDLLMAMEDCTIKLDPLGVVLIIGAWNYPLQLIFMGLVGAFAAGNCAVLKPSEVSGHTADVIATLVPKYFEPGVVSVVTGGVAETTELLNQRFDHIMYTGNSTVARIVMAAAAKNLTPVTLELGGKSPCVVDQNVDLRVAARRIAWGRTSNCGQTCVAPDYIMVHESIKAKFITELKLAIVSFLGENPKDCKDYARIVNSRHFERIKKLMDGGKIIYGGETDAASNYIAPTIIDNVDLKHPLMTDEIFGPLFPIMTFGSSGEVIDFINDREKPLALYLFSNNSAFIKEMETNTSSGAFVVNDTLMHAGIHTLPFGGVGESGMGAYHGKLTMETFSHKKAVMKRKLIMEGLNDMRYMPYSDSKLGRLKMLGLLKNGPESPTMKIILGILAVGVAAGIAVGLWRYFQ